MTAIVLATSSLRLIMAGAGAKKIALGISPNEL